MKFKSQVYAQASGSIGGITYSHNKGGMYTRTRAIPTNPNSRRQQRVRAAMGGALKRWTSTLTAAQRLAWETYALQVPVLDTLGELKTLSGQQHYLRSNIPRIQTGLAPVDDGPTIFDTGEPPIVPFGASFSILTNVFSNDVPLAAPASADGVMICFVHRGSVAATHTFFKGPYQYAARVGFSAAATSAIFSSDVTDPAQWFASYVPSNGDNVGARFVCSYDDGRYSQDDKRLMTAVVA